MTLFRLNHFIILVAIFCAGSPICAQAGKVPTGASSYLKVIAGRIADVYSDPSSESSHSTMTRPEEDDHPLESTHHSTWTSLSAKESTWINSDLLPVNPQLLSAQLRAQIQVLDRTFRTDSHNEFNASHIRVEPDTPPDATPPHTDEDLPIHLSMVKEHLGWQKASTDQVTKLVQCIEGARIFFLHHRVKKTSCTIDGFDPVEVEADQNLNLYVKNAFSDKPLGAGGFKTVERVYSYTTWNSVAKAEFRTFDESVDLELRLLKLISELPNEKRTGLPETYSADESRIFQKMYDSNLFELVFKKRSVRSKIERIRLLSKVAQGLVQLHTMGIVHGDIKPENILYNEEDQSAVLTDFGGSYFPEEKLNSTKPILGTPGYFAPETYCEDWNCVGSSNEEKIENDKKRDVFALGMTANEIYNLSLNRTIDPKDLIDKVERMVRIDSFNYNFDPISFLIFSALHPHVKKRISSRQFLIALEHILTKLEPHERTSASREKLVESIGNEPGFKDISMDLALRALQNHPAGSYLLFPFENERRTFSVGLSFVSEQNGVQIKRLNSDPAHLQKIQDELKLLEILGILNQPMTAALDL